MVSNDKGNKERELWNLLLEQKGSERGQTLFTLSLLAFENGQHKKSLALAKSACECFISSFDESEQANCQTSIAFNLKQIGKTEEAIQFLLKAVTGYSNMRDSQEWEYRMYLADWFREEEYFELSLMQVNLCLEYFRDENSSFEIANTICYVASLLCEQGKCSDSIEKLQEARAIYKREKNPALVGAIDIELSKCFNHLEDGVNAQTFALKALGVFDSINNEGKKAQVYAQLGKALNTMGEYQKALEYLNLAHVLVTGHAPINFYDLYTIQESKISAMSALGRIEEANALHRSNSIINETLQWVK